MKQPYKEVVEVQETVGKLRNYLDKIQSLSNVNSLFDYEFYFELDSSFPHEQFANSLFIHAYFVCDPATNKLSLSFISSEQDEELAGAVQQDSASIIIYEAPSIQTSSIPIPKSHLPVENTYEMAERWSQQRESWLTEVFNSEHGLTLVSDVPVADITEHFTENDQLQVYLGLRGEDTPDPSLKLSLLFYDPANESFLIPSTDDFSTPKPPFGKNKGKNKYGLLKMAESLVV